MSGIRSWGAYIPMMRLQLAAIAGGGRKAGAAAGERAVAYYDEDAVTMAVAAATNCLDGIDRGSIDGLLFASTSYDYKEKQGAAVIAKALDLDRNAVTADLAASVRAGTTALRAALDAVAAGSARNVLVVASDCRPAPPRSPQEKSFGDGAAAFLVSRDDVRVAIDAAHFVTDEIIDVWRTDRDPWVKSWEDRFVLEHGYQRTTAEVCRGLFAKTGSTAADFARAVLFGPDARSQAGLAKALGIDAKTRLQPALFGRLGNAGAAFAPLLLVAALEQAQPGERLLLANYGDGAEAFALTVQQGIGSLPPRRGVAWHLGRRTELDDYDKYLAFRDLQPSTRDRRGGAGVSATVHYRERDQDISFHGHRCRHCGQEQFPFQRVCFSCFARDDFDSVRLSDRRGRVLAFTFDNFAGSPDAPLIVATVGIDGGARAYLQMTDARPQEVRLDMPVEFTFRRIHEYGGTPNYFWKCTPVREEAPR